MSRATDDLFDELHAMTAETLKAQLDKYRDGREPVPPALLAQAIKFMKDNGIDSPARAKDVADKLAPHMPDFGPEDVADERAH